MRDRPNDELDCRKLSLVHLRPHKSYIGAVYICASCSAPSDVLNLIFKARFTRFKGRFSPGSQNLQQKNARAQSQPSSSLIGLLGGWRESFIIRVPQESHSWISGPLG